jgi:putative sterol carrier protein
MPELEDVLNEFLPLCENDPAMQEFARKRKMNVQYVLPDAQLQFFIHFQEGVVSCGGGKPPAAPHFTISMSKQTFEEVMSGKRDANALALSGEIKFKGDPMKAMSLQKTSKDMVRLWLKALEMV